MGWQVHHQMRLLQTRSAMCVHVIYVFQDFKPRTSSQVTCFRLLLGPVFSVSRLIDAIVKESMVRGP